MSKQAQNFVALCTMEANSVASIKMALSMLKSSVKQELYQHYSVSNDAALAAKLAR